MGKTFTPVPGARRTFSGFRGCPARSFTVLRPVASLRGAGEPRMPLRASAARPGPLPRLSAPDDTTGQPRFPHTAVLFAVALANGWPWPLALLLIAGVSFGSLSNGGFIISYGLTLSLRSYYVLAAGF